MTPAPVAEHQARLDGTTVHWVEAGEGEPLVFIHGFSSDRHSWDLFLGRIPGFRTIALDLPGHGLSGKPLVPYTAAYYARTLRLFLERSGIGPATLVGLSLGGLVAGRTAIDDPEWVTRLVLVDAAGVGPRPQSWKSRLQFAPMLFWQTVGVRSRGVTRSFLRAVLGDRPGLVTEKLVDLSLQTQQQSRLASFLTAFTLMLPDARLYPDLHRILAPTLVIWGEEDSVFPMKDAHAAAARIPRAQVAIVPGAGHGPNLQEPRVFLRLLTDFLGAPAS